MWVSLQAPMLVRKVSAAHPGTMVTAPSQPPLQGPTSFPEDKAALNRNSRSLEWSGSQWITEVEWWQWGLAWVTGTFLTSRGEWELDRTRKEKAPNSLWRKPH